MKTNLKFSILFILCCWIGLSRQQCIDTTRIKGSEYSFALAPIDDISNPLAPQESCHYSCGAEIVTRSANKGDMSRLTMLDNAIAVLLTSNFLENGQIYLLNHLGMKEQDGGNGIGCIEILPGNKIKDYPKSNPKCLKARVAICGFWGEQKIPVQPSMISVSSDKHRKTKKTKSKHHSTKTSSDDISISTSSSSTYSVTLTETKSKQLSTQSSSNIPTTTTTTTNSFFHFNFPKPTTTISTTKTVSSLVVVSTTLYEMKPLIHGPLLPTNPNIIAEFSGTDKTRYQVVTSHGNTVKDATLACQNTKSKLSSLSSKKYDAMAFRLKTTTTSGIKMIIGSWNSDGYSSEGSKCLILQVNYGIYPGNCIDTTAVLCEL